MRRRLLLAWLLTTLAGADKFEGTLVSASLSGSNYELAFRDGDRQSLSVQASPDRCREILRRGLGSRWTLFGNPLGPGQMHLTSSSSLGADPQVGEAFQLIRTQIELINRQQWSQAIGNFAQDGRPDAAHLQSDWGATLLSVEPADMQTVCSNPDRVSVVVGGTRARLSSYNPRFSRVSSAFCRVECERLQGRWYITSMRL